MNAEWRSSAVMGAVGAFAGLVTFAFFVSSNGFSWGIGAIFGLLVTPPLVRWSAYPVPKVLAMGAVSAAAYVIAIIVVQWVSDIQPESALVGIVAFAAAGASGAGLIGLGLLAILGRGRALGVVGPMLAAGTAAGLAFVILPEIIPHGPFEYPVRMGLGFMIWQSSVAAPLGRLLRDSKTPLPEV